MCEVQENQLEVLRYTEYKIFLFWLLVIIIISEVTGFRKLILDKKKKSIILKSF